jgi:hypothetical protein
MSQAPGYEPGSTGTRTKHALCAGWVNAAGVYSIWWSLGCSASTRESCLPRTLQFISGGCDLRLNKLKKMCLARLYLALRTCGQWVHTCSESRTRVSNWSNPRSNCPQNASTFCETNWFWQKEEYWRCTKRADHQIFFRLRINSGLNSHKWPSTTKSSCTKRCMPGGLQSYQIIWCYISWIIWCQESSAKWYLDVLSSVISLVAAARRVRPHFVRYDHRVFAGAGGAAAAVAAACAWADAAVTAGDVEALESCRMKHMLFLNSSYEQCFWRTGEQQKNKDSVFTGSDRISIAAFWR